MSEIVSKRDFGPDGFRWTTLKQILWRDPTGRLRNWESAERTTRRGPVDGVAIIAHVTGGGGPHRIILESQFRPPQGNTVIELPAGLVDEGETAAQAAVRELKEETGYSGTIGRSSSVCFSDPGMTNANMQFVDVHVDADAPENVGVQPELEEGEFINVFMLPVAGLFDRLLELQKEKGWDVDARLLMYAAGVDDGAMAAALGPGSQETAAAAHSDNQQADRVQTAARSEQPSEAGTLAPTADAAALEAERQSAASPPLLQPGANDGITSAAAAASPAQQPPAGSPAKLGADGTAAADGKAAASGEGSCHACPHCGHDPSGQGLLGAAVQGLSHVGSRVLLSRAGSGALPPRPPPAVEVCLAQPGSVASLRGLDRQGSGGDGAALDATGDIGQPDSLHPRDMKKGPAPIRMSTSELAAAGIESVRIVPRGTLRWRRVDRWLLTAGAGGLLLGLAFSQVVAGMALAIGLNYHPSHRLSWSQR